MLETYFEEITRKRRWRRIFWLVVLAFATFLYLFFQGYYPYVRFDVAQFFTERPMGVEVPPEKPQVVRAFGIINVRTSPAPDMILIRQADGKERLVANDDKNFLDFGKYFVRVEKAGYVPLSLDILLDRVNAFSINVFNLLKTPAPKEFRFLIDRADILENGGLLVREKVSERENSWTGRVYRFMEPNFANISGTGFLQTEARPMGGGYFESNGGILVFDPTTKTLKSLGGTSLTGSIMEPCFEAEYEGAFAYCPETGEKIPLATWIRERFLGFGGRLITTEKTISHVENGRLLSRQKLLTGSGETLKAQVKITGKTFFLSGGTIQTETSEDSGFSNGMLDSVASVHEFWNETVLLGFSGATAAFVLLDERGNRYFGKIPDARLSEISVDSYRWAYVFYSPKGMYMYYKGATEPIEILRDVPLFTFWNGVILFEKYGKTFSLELEMGEK